MSRRLLLPLLVTPVLAGAADARAADVSIARYAFAPATVTVRQGEQVTWTFAGPDTNHSVTTQDGQPEAFDSDPGRTPTALDHLAGTTYARTFAVAGTIRYVCKVHPDMRGTVVVQGQDDTPADTTAPVLGPVRVERSGRRTRLRVVLSEAARTVVTLRRGATRLRLVRALPAGPSRVLLPRGLARGRYAVTVQAQDAAGNAATPRRVPLVVRR